MFSRDGRYLYGSSYYTGVSNIFRYEVATGEVEAVSNAETGFFRPVPLADGRLVVLDYTGEGFVPAIIDPRPIEDVSAITFLGAEVAEKHPVVKTWQVPPPEHGRRREADHRQGAVRAAAQPRARRTPIRCCRATRTTSASATTSTSRIRCASRTSASPPPTRRAASLPANERGHVDITGHYLGWRADALVEPLGLLRPLRPDQAQPQGLRRQGRLRLARSSTTSRAARRQVRPRLLRQDRHAAERAERRHDLHAPRDRRGRAPLHRRAALARRGRRREGRGVVAGRQRQASVNGEITPQVRGTLDFGFPLPLPHSSIWLRSAAGVRQRRPQQHRREFLLRRLRQQLCRQTSRSSAIASTTRCPASRSTRSAGSNFVREMVEWNLPPFVFESVGTPGFHLTLAAAGDLRRRRCGRTPATRRSARTTRASAARSTCSFSVLHWYDMTLSVGYAVGLPGRASARVTSG